MISRFFSILALALFAGPTWASYECDAANENLTGTLTTDRALPLTLFAYVKYANHPEAINSLAQFGTPASNQNGSVALKTRPEADRYTAQQRTPAGNVVGANVDAAAGAGDGVWFPLVGVFTSTTLRDIYAGAIETTAQETTSNDPGTAISVMRLCENLAGAEDSTTLLIAEVGIVDEAATAGEIEAFLDGADPTTIWSVAAELIGYWPLDMNNSTQANEGSDAGGDLTVSGATFNADHPTFAAPAAPSFTAGPTPGTLTDTTIPFTFTLDQTGTVYGVACPDGQAAPSVAQVKVGDCTGDVAAEDAFTEAVIEDVSDGNTFSGLTAETTYDTHFAATGTDLDTAAITSVENQTTEASVPSGGGGGFLPRQRYATADTIYFLMLDEAGLILTGETGNSIVFEQDSDGTEDAADGTYAEVGGGWYKLAVTTGEMTGQFIRMTCTDCDPVQSFVIPTYGDPSAQFDGTDIRDLIIEDQGGGVSLACALAVALAYVSGDLATTGGTSTYEDPSGTETRIEGTVASPGNRLASITCPTY
jgi:hypothetical protein